MRKSKDQRSRLRPLGFLRTRVPLVPKIGSWLVARLRRKEVANWAAVAALVVGIVGITLGAISVWYLREQRQREKTQVLITVTQLLGDAWDKLGGKRGAETANLSLAINDEERSGVIEAGRKIDQVLRLDPQNITAWGYKGIYLTKLGQYDAAEDVFRYGLVLAPRNAWLYGNRGLSRIEAGKQNLGISDLKTSIELNPTEVYGRLALGGVLESQGKLDEAVVLYRKASEITTILPEPHMRIADVLLKRGELDKAISEYRKAAAGQPQSSETYTALAWAELLSGNPERGVVDIEMALQMAPRDPYVLQGQGAFYLMTGRLKEASLHLGEAVRLSPNNAEARALLGLSLLSISILGQENTDEGCKQLRTSLALDPEALAAMWGDGWCKFFSDDYAHGAASLRKFVAVLRREHIPGTVWTRYVGGIVKSNPLLSDATDVKSAQADIVSAPKDPDGYISLAFVYLINGQSKLGLDAIHNAERYAGASDGSSQIGIGMFYIMQGQFDEAERFFAMAEAPSNK
ncbi:MAG: hypothetical protein A3H27_08050 [Acidobacteria bacterium RIFCSPLOWO2_02_FULL_59_13]|nr:MAG: hypothetical protein A3H27_08050 [Acidobacteria bacterium RIFCSPLOWO2_02_FULL_59_13]